MACALEWADLLDSTGGALVIPLAITFLLTLLRALLRRDWLAGAVVVLISVLPGLLNSSLSVAVEGLIFNSLIVLAFIRFGQLALATSILIYFWVSSLPLTTNLSAWYAGTSLFDCLPGDGAGRACFLHFAGRAEGVARQPARGLICCKDETQML